MSVVKNTVIGDKTSFLIIVPENSVIYFDQYFMKSFKLHTMCVLSIVWHLFCAVDIFIAVKIWWIFCKFIATTHKNWGKINAAGNKHWEWKYSITRTTLTKLINVCVCTSMMYSMYILNIIFCIFYDLLSRVQIGVVDSGV